MKSTVAQSALLSLERSIITYTHNNKQYTLQYRDIPFMTKFHNRLVRIILSWLYYCDTYKMNRTVVQSALLSFERSIITNINK